MKLESEESLRRTYEHIVRMYDLIDRLAADTTGYPETREDEIESVRAMIYRLERQIAAYHALHPERLAEPTPKWKLVEEFATEEPLPTEAREPEPVT